jgi:WD40 repeat protein
MTRYPNFREQWDPELMTLPGPGYDLAISGDGKTLASTDHDGAVKVWDLSTGSEMAKFSCSDAGSAIAISRNGKTVARALTGGEISLQSLTDDGESILTSDNKDVRSIAFSPTNGVLAALSHDNTILLWDLETLELIHNIAIGHGENNYRYPLVFSPCGQLLLAGGGYAITGGIFVWDLKTQTQRIVMKHEGYTEAIAMSPDGHRIASSDDHGDLKVWSEATAATLGEIKFREFALSLAWHPTQPPILAVAQGGMSVSLCNTATASVQIIKDFDVYGSRWVPLNGLAFSGSLDIMVTVDSKGRVRTWDTGMASVTPPKRQPIRDIQFLENGRRVLIVSEYSSELLDLDTGSRKQFLDDMTKVVRSPSRDLFAICSRKNMIQFWDATLSKEVKTYSEASDIFFPQDSNVVVLMSHDKALVLDDQTLSHQSTIELPGQWVSAVTPVFTGEEMCLVAKVCGKEPEYILVYRLATGKGISSCQYPIIINHPYAWDEKVMQFSPDGEILICQTRHEDGRPCFVVVYFKTNISQEIMSLEDDKFSTSPIFSPMGDYVAIGTSSGNIFVWDTKSISQVRNLVTGAFPVIQLHFCTSDRIAVGIQVNGRLKVQLWDMERRQLLEEMQIGDGSTQSLYFFNHWADRLHFDMKQGWLPLPSYDKTNLCRFIAKRETYLLDVQAGWIWQGNDRILLLPADFYQGSVRWKSPCTTLQVIYYPIAAVYGSRIVLGLASGDVTVFEFDRSKMLFEMKSGNGLRA